MQQSTQAQKLDTSDSQDAQQQNDRTSGTWRSGCPRYYDLNNEQMTKKVLFTSLHNE